MRKHYKARQIRFCPLCGSDVVTHLGDSVFVCGTGDPQIEAEGKLEGTNTRCNRAFGVVHPVHYEEENGRYRRMIGKIVTDLRNNEVFSEVHMGAN